MPEIMPPSKPKTTKSNLPEPKKKLLIPATA
jgi:hypothetical protein